MKKKLFIFVLMAVMLFMITGYDLSPSARINAPAATPTPAGQITVPSVSIQLNLPGPNPLVNEADAQGRVAGVLLGIWHGIISPITLIVSFVNPSVHMYEVHNDGSPYDLGFLLGMAIVFVILGAGAGSRRR